jgi:hypothetical protein
VAAIGVSEAGHKFRQVVDEVLGSFWEAAFHHGRTQEESGGGYLVRRAGLAAIPYWLRLERWVSASNLLEHVILRDGSAAAVAAALPPLQAIAKATIGTEDELFVRGKLARALEHAGQVENAEREMREVIQLAVERQQFRVASGVAGDLIYLFLRTGRLLEARNLASKKARYTKKAGLGPWTQLSDNGTRLRVLADLGRHKVVLKMVEVLRARLITLPDDGVEEESVLPWIVRERIFDIARSSAMQSQKYEAALEINQLIKENMVRRQASRLEQASASYNDYKPLLVLRRYDEARSLLETCRAIFEEEGDIESLGGVLTAIADLEYNLHGARIARSFEERAIRYHYFVGKPGNCAISHMKMSFYIMCDTGNASEALAHQLAAMIVILLTGSGEAEQYFNTFAVQVAELGESAQGSLPNSFPILCAAVEAIEGVHFRELADRLNVQIADFDTLLGAVIAKGLELAAHAAANIE